MFPARIMSKISACPPPGAALRSLIMCAGALGGLMSPGGGAASGVRARSATEARTTPAIELNITFTPTVWKTFEGENASARRTGSRVARITVHARQTSARSRHPNRRWSTTARHGDRERLSRLVARRSEDPLPVEPVGRVASLSDEPRWVRPARPHAVDEG